MRASLPMYDVRRADVELLWQGIAYWLRREGVMERGVTLSWPEDFYEHWQQPDLLLSQTCGFPLQETLRDRVEVVGAFSYLAEGCEDIDYRSMLVARADERADDIADFRDRRAAYNSEDSHSGYNALRALIAPLAKNGCFFASAHRTGSHYHSLLAVKHNEADIAAVDCVTLALLQREKPALLQELRVIGMTPAAPGLPLVTSARNAEIIPALRRALREAMSDVRLQQVRDDLLIGSFHPVGRGLWQRCTELKQLAQRYGVTQL